MAVFHPERFIVLLLMLMLAGPQQAQAVLTGLRLPITVDADSSNIDGKNKRLLFRGVRITQGDLAIEADRAEASQLDFENALWIFRGNVRIELQTALIESDEAKLNFFDHTLSSAIIEGTPAQFEQRVVGEPEPTRGQAGTMEYDFLTGTVKLTEEAWIRRGSDEISGNTLVYNINEERMVATSDGTDSPVKITITPRNRDRTPSEDGE